MTDERPEAALLSPDDVALLLHRHPVTIRRQLRAGLLPGVKHGGAWYVRRQDLDRLMTPDGAPQ
jgi:hypothetical protein